MVPRFGNNSCSSHSRMHFRLNGIGPSSVRDVEGALRFTSRERWRKWLEKNHATKIAALLVVYKRPPKNEKFPSRHARSEGLGVMLTMGNNLRMIDNLQHRLGILREEV